MTIYIYDKLLAEEQEKTKQKLKTLNKILRGEMKPPRRRVQAPASLVQNVASITPFGGPQELNLTGWWKASYSGVPWVKNASAGTSGSGVDLTTNATQPTTGSAVNGLTPAAFNGHVLRALTNVNNLFSTSAWSIAILCNPTSIINDTGIYSDLPALATDQDLGLVLGLRTSGGTPQVFVNNYLVPTTLTLSAWQLVQAKFNGTTLYIRVNGSTRNSTTTTFPAFGTTQMYMGVNYFGNRFFVGSILESMTMNTCITDNDEDNVLNYMRTRYALSLT